MTFNQRTKMEMCRAEIGECCCALAESYGIFLLANSFGENGIKILTSFEPLLPRLSSLLSLAFNILPEDYKISETKGGKKALIITGDPLKIIFSYLGCDFSRQFALHLNLGAIEGECCRGAFLRGLFLSGGVVSDPEREYHLELATPHQSLARELSAFLIECGFLPRMSKRMGHAVIYFKDSAAAEDFLTMTGAPVASMELMQAKIYKDVRNRANRQVNCDSANIAKTVRAGQAQADAINRLLKTVGEDEIPEHLHDVAILRRENPDASLSDLAALARLSKSGINHRLQKLMEMAKEC